MHTNDHSIRGKNLIRCILLPVVILIALLLNPLPSGATDLRQINKISFSKGLPNAFVNDMAQDPMGFIWVGTNAGLYRYDGYTFKAFRGTDNNYSLRGNYIKKIEVTDDGMLWIGTLGSGLYCLDTRMERFTDLKLPLEVRRLNINDFYRESDSLIWLATEKGLARLTLNDDLSEIDFFYVQKQDASDSDTSQQTQTPQLEFVNFIEVGQADNHRFLWVGINEKLYAFNLATLKFQEIPTSPKFSFRSILQMNDGFYLAGFWYGGFMVFDHNKKPQADHPLLKTLHKLPDEVQVNNIYQDEGQILIATENHGLVIVKQDEKGYTLEQLSNATTDGALRSDAIGCAMRDNSGLLWLGHLQAGGLSQVNDNESRILRLLDISGQEKYTNVRDIALYQNRYLLAATMGEGLHIYDLQTGDLLQGSEKKNADFMTRSNEYHSLLMDSRGHLWLGTKGKGVEFIHHEALDRIIENQGSSSPISSLINNSMYPGMINDYIMSLGEDGNGNVWIGSWRGVYVFQQNLIRKLEAQKVGRTIAMDDIITFTHHTYLREVTVLSITSRENGDIFLGTRHKGLIRLSHSRDNTIIKPENMIFKGYPVLESVYSLQINNDTLLVASNAGVMQINLSHDQVMNFVPIERFDFMEPVGVIRHKERILVSGSYGIKVFEEDLSGMQTYLLPDDERYNQYNYNSFVIAGDTVYAGSFTGVNQIYFPETTEAHNNFPLRISNLSINDEPVRPGKRVRGRTLIDDNINYIEEITLRSGSENIISLDLALMEFSDPAMNQFKYRLRGVHEDFIMLSTGQSNITFANLKPSSYELEIRGVGKNAMPAENDILLSIKVLPPWYQSGVAYLVYILLIASAFIGISRFYILRDRQKNELRLERANRKKSEELYQYKMEFFTNISHEIRTPMSLIMGPLEQLMQKEHTPADKENLSLISENATRLLFLLDQILNVRKLDNNKMEIKKKRTDIVAFCHKIFSMYKKHAQLKNINYVFQSSQPKISFGFDPFVVETVLFNLLSNAFKYVHNGGQIIVQLDYNDQDPLRISVKDNGIGISHEDQQYVFDRFFTANQEKSGLKSRNIKGNGIGLSLSQDMAELHGGKIKVKSQPGAGSTFTLMLQDDKTITDQRLKLTQQPEIDPLKLNMVEIELNILQHQENLSANETIRSPEGNLYHIMLIDDNLELLKFLKASLQERYKITAVASAEQALVALEESHPDLIVSDIMMPGMNGLELVRHIKGTPKLYNIPVVLLSARAREKQSQEGYMAGADAYISKPFSMGFLITRINQIINAREKMKDSYKDSVLMSPSKVNIQPEEKQFMDKMIEVIEENMDNDSFGVEDFAKALNMSRAKLYRKVAKISDKSVKEIIRDIRLQRGEELLRTNVFSVNEVSYKVGFINASYFIKCFRDKFGKTPKELMEEIQANHKKEAFMEDNN